MFPDIRDQIICIDVETNGLNWLDPRNQVFGVALSFANQDFYWDIRKTPRAVDWLKSEVPKVNLVVNHNIKFDMHFLDKIGIHIDPRRAHCTQVRAALIDEHLPSYSLDNLLKKYLGISKYNAIYDELAGLFGGKPTRNAQMPNLHRAPASLVAKYAKDDSRGALRLWQWQEEEIQRQKLGRVWDLERRLFPVVYQMECQGVRVDLDAAEVAADQLTHTIERDLRTLRDLAGFEVNPNPSGSIKQLFKPQKGKDGVWRAIDGTELEETDGGNPSLCADALRRMKHPAAPMILKCRKLAKARDTFINGHIIEHSFKGRVHPTINQTKGGDKSDMAGTGTGRLSYTGPALQQIPARDKEIASVVRPLFLPEPGHGWSYGDLDQHEYRVFAHYVNNPEIIAAYRKDPDLDFHQKVADLTGLPRSPTASGGPNAKQLNLGMVFMMGSGHMADLCGLDWEWDEFETREGEVIKFQRAGPEALELVEKYHAAVPGIREMATKAKRIALSRGYVVSLRGRHIRFPMRGTARKASGLLYQAGAADLNKENMILAHEYLQSECPDARLLLNVHDEYSVSLPPGDEQRILRGLRGAIEDKPEMRVPIRIDFGLPAPNWWEATKTQKAT